ncbi:unnamed protein product [Leptosia nina]|uniref:Uncharacterized protein n=1 Tax=Leptosia nina TaxID=320188 RepID=A0AAV1J5J2_9NEOP
MTYDSGQDRASPAQLAVPGDTQRAAGVVPSTLTHPGSDESRPADDTPFTPDIRGDSRLSRPRRLPGLRARRRTSIQPALDSTPKSPLAASRSVRRSEQVVQERSECLPT